MNETYNRVQKLEKQERKELTRFEKKQLRKEAHKSKRKVQIIKRKANALASISSPLLMQPLSPYWFKAILPPIGHVGKSIELINVKFASGLTFANMLLVKPLKNLIALSKEDEMVNVEFTAHIETYWSRKHKCFAYRLHHIRHILKAKQ